MGDLVSIYNKQNIRKTWFFSSDTPQKKSPVDSPQMYNIHHLENHISPSADPALNIVRTTLGMQHVAPQLLATEGFRHGFEMC